MNAVANLCSGASFFRCLKAWACGATAASEPADTAAGGSSEADGDAAEGAPGGRIRPTELADVMYSPRNCDAARQLFRVTSGLESMIVGEDDADLLGG